MTVRTSTRRRKRRKSNSKSKQRNTLNLQKPRGVIGPRVKRVGGERFAIVCVDPAKHRSAQAIKASRQRFDATGASWFATEIGPHV